MKNYRVIDTVTLITNIITKINLQKYWNKNAIIQY